MGCQPIYTCIGGFKRIVFLLVKRLGIWTDESLNLGQKVQSHAVHFPNESLERGTSSVENGTRRIRTSTTVQTSLRAESRRHSVSEGYIVKLRK